MQASDTTARFTALGRIGALCAARPKLILALWVAAVVLLLAVARVDGGIFNDNVNLPGTQAYQGLALLDAHQRSAGGYTGQVVMHVAGGTLEQHAGAIERSLSALRALPHVSSASDPLATGSHTLSSDGRTAYSTVHFNVEPKTLGIPYQSRLRGAMSATTHAGVEVQYGGGLDALFRPKANDALSEVIGFAVALAVLLIGFGSVAAALLPLFSALLAVVAGVSVLDLAANGISFGTTAPTLALMIGLGVGIDYALFQATRFRQLIADGDDPVHAAGVTVSTSGHAVLVAASTVALALLGLYASGVTFIGQLGLAAVFGVVTAALAAITLVPAAFGLLGRRIDVLHVRTPVAEAGSESDGWHRYAARVAARPWRHLLSGVLVLAVLAIPLLSINLGHIDDGADPTGYTDRQAYDLIASAFGQGANGSLTVVVRLAHAGTGASTLAQTVAADLTAVRDVAHVTPLQPSRDGALLIGTVIPASSPQATASRTLYSTLVDNTLPRALRGSGARGYVTGAAASQIQFRDRITARLPVVILTVLALEFLLLMATFRSLLVALKAAVMNLLSIGAAYGVIVAVFQWGWGRGLLGVAKNVPIESYVPVLMFAIVFGLSMDYEVFLLSRIKEAWDRGHDNTAAVAAGLTSTARVITCAALIMASVFFAFVLSSNVVVKMLAVGLSVSVLVDASIVRLVLVPATMTLLGTANWWLPRWLDRILPRIEAEPPGPGPVPGPAGAGGPGGHPRAAGDPASADPAAAG